MFVKKFIINRSLFAFSDRFIKEINRFNCWINRFIYWINEFNYWVYQSQYYVSIFSAVRWQILTEISQLNCTSHTSNAHQICIFISQANGRTTVPTSFQTCLYTIFFYLTQNWKIKIFLLWYVRTIMRRLKIFRETVLTNYFPIS